MKLDTLRKTWSLKEKKKGKEKFFYHISHTVPMVIIRWRHSNVWKSTVGAIYWTTILIIPSYSCSLFFHLVQTLFVGVLFLNFFFSFHILINEKAIAIAMT